MLESQKLNFHQFMTDWKHGVYILTSDSCEICLKYKQKIEYINNGNLYFVDVVSSKDRDIVYQITERGSFPMTVVFRDNNLEFVRLGELFDKQLEEIFLVLKEFGETPLSESEKQQRMLAFKSKCELSYYVFPPNIKTDIKQKLIDLAITFNELPISVDDLSPTLNTDDRFHLFEGMMPYAKLIVFKDSNTNSFSPFAQRILMSYTSRIKNQQIIIRNIEETINATNCTSNY